ncbi:LANO_0E01112g1_1 [Lachancea nothofagi CBS 11611]|uniref:LANO_0E01112g1_1 n=1 Tax=Lachancea nothofagi CBS 11611 TaxID=1266666 RepID=A0A1G4JP43_9SACH|nr:LANO_0E01112g1_1 [Lachancea nothofagi CBS 11611]
MLFKQWNDFSEPRHHMDAPLEDDEDFESLQLATLPEVKLEQPIVFSKYKRIIITTKVFRSLFSSKLAHANQVSKFQIQWHTKGKDHLMYREDFQVQEDNSSKSESRLLEFPVEQIDSESLFVSVAEDFLHVPPIALNLLSKEIAKLCAAPLDILLIGSSDRIEEIKQVGFPTTEQRYGLPGLNPPEFLTNFTASIMTQLISNKVHFHGYVAPSEGPSGYEKLSMETMDQLIDLCWSESRGSNREMYVKECHRNWKLNGTAMGAQSGLYL